MTILFITYSLYLKLRFFFDFCHTYRPMINPTDIPRINRKKFVEMRSESNASNKGLQKCYKSLYDVQLSTRYEPVKNP